MSAPLPEWTQALRARVGDDGYRADAASIQAFAAGDVLPLCVCSPATPEQLAEVLAFAHHERLAVIAAGNGGRLDLGRPPRRYDLAISTRRLVRILAHEAADLTVTVEAGVTIAELNAGLAKFDQHLPLDPPQPQTATIGGIIATDSYGSLRHSQGKVRDLLIGIRAVLADGTLVKGGGRVVKNVAGYDLMKLITGSLGTLAIIVDASFKLRPRPPQSRLVKVECDDLGDAIDICLKVRDWPVEPLSVRAFDVGAAGAAPLKRPAVVLSFGGTVDEIAAQQLELAARLADVTVVEAADAAALEVILRDFPCGSSSDQWLARISTSPTRLRGILATADSIAADHRLRLSTVVQPLSGQAWLKLVDAEGDRGRAWAESLRAAVEAERGHLMLAAVPSPMRATIDPWGAMPAEALQRRIRAALDPAEGLSPGRLFA